MSQPNLTGIKHIIFDFGISVLYPMNIIKVFLVYFLFFSGCSVTDLKRSNKLLGKWELTEKKFQVNYPILYFNTDSTAMFASRGDTIYRFKYQLRSGKLILKDFIGQESVWKIIKLDGRKLIIDKLFENNNPQHYKKVPNDMNNR